VGSRLRRLPNAAEPAQYPARRFLSLLQRESFCFYSGSVADAGNEETPLMGALLHRIFAAARALEERGRITVKVKIASKKDDPTNVWPAYDFVGTGLPAAEAA
jgi:hypothetical protein